MPDESLIDAFQQLIRHEIEREAELLTASD